VALVGVNSPYAAFERSPEARAVRAAAALGTLVVAPAGHEGAALGTNGTAGSPAAAPDALAVGALAATGAVARLDLRVGGADARGAVLLAGDPPPDGLRTAGPVESTDPAELLVGGAGSLRGRLAVVRAGDQPVARAAAAAAAGARAVLLAEPRRRPLPAIPAGRISAPVLGVTGAVAAAVLDEDAGEPVQVGDVGAGRPPAAGTGTAELSPFSSRGPAAGGGVVPALAAPGAALTALPGSSAAIVGGGAIAAAHAAVEAARLARQRPDASPRALREALVGAAARIRGCPRAAPARAPCGLRRRPRR
jgi:hypothetical protein